MRSFSGLTHKTTQKFRSHRLNGNQIGNSREKLWEHASAVVFWETQILLVWLPLCLWSWYNDFPCDSEMWSSLFGALQIAAHSPTVCTQKQPSSISCTRPGATESSRRPRSYLPVRNSREVPGSLLSQLCGTRAHLSCSGDSSACTHAFEAAMLAHMWYYKWVLLAETQLFCVFFFMCTDVIAATSRKEEKKGLIVGWSHEYEGYIRFCADRQLYKLTRSQSAVYWLIQDCLLRWSHYCTKFTLMFALFKKNSSLIMGPSCAAAPDFRPKLESKGLCVCTSVHVSHCHKI